MFRLPPPRIPRRRIRREPRHSRASSGVNLAEFRDLVNGRLPGLMTAAQAAVLRPDHASLKYASRDGAVARRLTGFERLLSRRARPRRLASWARGLGWIHGQLPPDRLPAPGVRRRRLR